jgi:integrase
MPRYNKKITRLMDYDEFKDAIQELPEDRQAFLSILFFTGCRVSEALALTPDDISCKGDTIYIQFFRLKGSKQTDPQEIPRADALNWLCE